MNKSFKQRLEALEALEAAAEQSNRVLCVFLQIRPEEWAVLVGDDDDAAARVFVAYGLDQIGDGERVNVWGGTWPIALPWNELTIAATDCGDGYGSRIDAWPAYTNPPEPGEWRWGVAESEEVERLRAAQRAERLRVLHPLTVDEIRAALADLAAGLLRVRPFVPGSCTIHICRVHHGAYMEPNPAYYEPLCRVLDSRVDSGAPRVESADELRAVLLAALEPAP